MHVSFSFKQDIYKFTLNNDTFEKQLDTFYSK